MKEITSTQRNQKVRIRQRVKLGGIERLVGKYLSDNENQRGKVQKPYKIEEI
jgi:hypothetical protein